MTTQCSSSKKKDLISHNKQVPFEVVVSISKKDPRLLKSLELPVPFKDLFTKECGTVDLVDIQNRKFSVKVKESLNGRVELCHSKWREFVVRNVLGAVDSIRYFCFRYISDNVFEVLCFNDFGIQMSKDSNGRSFMKRCLIEASSTTKDYQVLHAAFLKDLNEKSEFSPAKKATMEGPEQTIGDMSVIYKYHHLNPELDQWRAFAIVGRQWSTFVRVNHITEGSILIFNNIGDGRFRVSVFSATGIGSAFHKLSPLRVHRTLLHSVSDNEEEDHVVSADEGRAMHHVPCGEGTSSGSRSFELVTFAKHQLTHKILTLPAPFVKKHEIYLYDSAKVFYGKRSFDAELKVLKDRRYPGVKTHVVLKYNWSKFLNESGMKIGDSIRIELVEADSVVGGDAVFVLF